MTTIAIAITAISSVVAYALAWWNGRRKRKEAEAVWKRLAEEQARRAAAAEKVVQEQGAIAQETQVALEKEIRHADEAQMAHPGDGPRRELQRRWERTYGSGGTGVPPRVPPAVPDRAAGGAGPGPAQDPGVRGKR